MKARTYIKPRAVDWRQVWIIYVRELRAAFREKTIVFNSLFIPLFLYPSLLWVGLTGMMFVTGQNEKFVSRVAVIGWPEHQPKLRQELARDRELELRDATVGRAALEQQIQLGQLDALLEFLPPTNPVTALPANFQARITYNQSKDRSDSALQRLNQRLYSFREGWLKREGQKLGVTEAAWQNFTLSRRNVASEKELGHFLLGLIAPVIFVVMVAMGTFYPAVDAIAGERERQTWETLMTSSVSRVSVVVAKYLYVTSLGGLAGLLNFLAIVWTFKPVFAPLMAQAGLTINFSVPTAALPVAVVVGLLLAGFIAAGMMILASFARNFKEGQAMTAPFYLLVMLPVVALQAPGLQFSLALACVPIINLTLVLREALTGVFHWPQIGLSLLVSLLAIALSLRLAASILQFEELLAGSSGGSWWQFIRRKGYSPSRATGTISPSKL